MNCDFYVRIGWVSLGSNLEAALGRFDVDVDKIRRRTMRGSRKGCILHKRKWGKGGVTAAGGTTYGT